MPNPTPVAPSIASRCSAASTVSVGVDLIVCTKCQHHNADSEKFCQRCGAFLEFSGKPVAGSPNLPPPGGDGPTTLPTPVVPDARDATQPIAPLVSDPGPTVVGSAATAASE